MKIASIGLGDIARKAYLPLLCTTNDIDVHLVTRTPEVLQTVATQYRIDPSTHCFTDISEAIDAGIQAAFVHVATNAHATVVRSLLEQGVHVFVDKPIAYDFDTAKSLVAFAEARRLILMVGFNRRYAPLYRWLNEMSSPEIILMQKNRRLQPGPIRTVIMDDFIHVVDTLRFLLGRKLSTVGDADDGLHGDDVGEVRAQGVVEEGQLHSIHLSLYAGSRVATGIMHRNVGFTEEQVEVFAPGEKRVVRNLSEQVTYKDYAVTPASNDWQPTLEKRGFNAMISTFVTAVAAAQSDPTAAGLEAARSKMSQSSRDALSTHAICEEIIRQIEH